MTRARDILGGDTLSAAPVAFELLPADRHLSLRELKQRGWSVAMVSELMAAPDALDCNVDAPKRPRRLWKVSRVLAAENSESFALLLRARRSREAAARRTFARKVAAIVQVAREIPISLDAVPLNYASQTRSIASSQGVLNFSDEHGRPLGWECLAVHHLLEALGPTQGALDEYFGAPGIRTARAVLRERQLTAIAARFPAFESECLRRTMEA